MDNIIDSRIQELKAELEEIVKEAEELRSKFTGTPSRSDLEKLNTINIKVFSITGALKELNRIKEASLK